MFPLNREKITQPTYFAVDRYLNEADFPPCLLVCNDGGELQLYIYLGGPQSMAVTQRNVVAAALFKPCKTFVSFGGPNSYVFM